MDTTETFSSRVRGRLNDARRETLFAELGSLLSSGLDFARAFGLLIGSTHDKALVAALSGIYDRVVAGRSLWRAAQASGKFSPLDCGVLRIGEETGRLAEALEFLAEYYRKKVEQRRMVLTAVRYPAVILCMTVAVVGFMTAVVVPMFEQVYSRMGGELPAMTRWIISVSGSLPARAGAVILALCAAAFVLWMLREREGVRRMVSNAVLGLPVAGTAVRKNVQARLCKLLYLLVGSGVPLLYAVEIMCPIVGFFPYRRSLEAVCLGLRRGELFSVNLGRYPRLYDARLVTLLRVGEETGRLPEMLARQADTLTRELEYSLRRLGSVLEPVLILVIGALVAVILVAMYLPMFRLGGAMG